MKGTLPKTAPRVLPIAQSTTFTYDSTQHVGELFDLTARGFFLFPPGQPYGRCCRAKIAALEGGVGALCTSSGQAANLIALASTFWCAGDHFIAAPPPSTAAPSTCLAVTMKKMGMNNYSSIQKRAMQEIKSKFRLIPQSCVWGNHCQSIHCRTGYRKIRQAGP